jgi:nucleotide-binding universal stress UspA family protein
MALDHGIGASTLAVARKLLTADGTITALHVYEAPKGTVSAYMDEGVVQAAFAQAKANMQERTADMPDVTGRVIAGHSGRTIIDYAKENGVDCIVIGSHKPGLIDYLLGSTAARVVRHAPCAVHVLRTS